MWCNEEQAATSQYLCVCLCVCVGGCVCACSTCMCLKIEKVVFTSSQDFENIGYYDNEGRESLINLSWF